MWATRKIPVVLIFTILFLFAVGCASESEENKLADEELIIGKNTTYRTKAAQKADLVRQVSTIVEPVYVDRRTITTGNRELVLENIEVKRGDRVKKGDVLAVLTGTGSQSDIRQLKLDLDFALKSYEETCVLMEASVEQAKRQPAEDKYAERIKELSVEKQRLAYELYKLNTESSISALREQVGKEEAAFGKQYICAPFDGIVRSTESLSSGSLLEPATPLVTISRSDSLVLFSNTAMDLLRYNKEVSVSVEYGDEVKTTTGRVVSSSNLMPGYFGSYVYIKPDNPDLLESAREAKVACDYTLLKDTVIIPRLGVNSDRGKQYVIILDGNATRKRYIVGGPQLINEAAVFQGVKPGDMIVTSRYTS